jgi:hypothetical protein
MQRRVSNGQCWDLAWRLAELATSDSRPLGQKQRVRHFAPAQGIARGEDHSIGLLRRMRELFCLISCQSCVTGHGKSAYLT